MGSCTEHMTWITQQVNYKGKKRDKGGIYELKHLRDILATCNVWTSFRF